MPTAKVDWGMFYLYLSYVAHCIIIFAFYLGGGRPVVNKKNVLIVPTVTEDYMEIDNLDISIGNDTKEWDGQRVNLWGIVPLWQSSPSPEVVLSLENPRPGDCWPFRYKL